MTIESGDGPDPTPPTSWQILAPLMDLVTPMAVRVAATLRLADAMRGGPVSLDDLAETSRADPDALGRLLRHLVAHGMFAEPRPGSFAVNETAALLDSDHPSGMRVSLDLTGFGGQMDLAFTELLHTVRTGESAWSRVFGTSFWEYLAGHDEMSASFEQVMSAGAEYVADDAASYDFSTASHVVDVGGGTGALLTEVLRCHTEARATLVELPETAARARERLRANGVGERVEVVGQSFFDALPPGGDVYVLNSVLHDWPDREAVAILRRCAEAAGDDGRVVFIEEHGADGGSHAEMDLRMLVLCGGRERTIEEYTRLAGEAGLAVTDIDVTPLGQVRIECMPGFRE